MLRKGGGQGEPAFKHPSVLGKNIYESWGFVSWFL